MSNDLNSIEDRLRNQLSSVEVTGSGRGLEGAVRKGRRYRNLRRAAAAGLGAVAVLSTIGVASFLLDGEGGGSGVAAEQSLTDPASDIASQTPLVGVISAAPVESALSWTVAPSEIVYTRNLFADERGFYAISTAPGVTWDPAEPSPLPQAVYRSADGVSWDHTLLAEDLWTAEFDYHNGTIYAVATAPSTVSITTEPLALTAAVSADLGRTWQSAALPTNARPPSYAEANFGWTDLSLAAGARGVIAVANTRYDVDFRPFLPEEFKADHFGISPSPDGVRVVDYSALMEAEEACAGAYDDRLGDPEAVTEVEVVTQAESIPEACLPLENGTLTPTVVYTATWEELGISGEEPTAHSELFVSADGLEYELVPWPFGPSVGFQQLIADDDGFLAVVWQRDQSPDLWRSLDGRTWEQRTLPQTMEFWGAPVFSDGERLVMTGELLPMEPATIPALAVSDDDGRSWSIISLGDLVPDGQPSWLSGIDVGAAGAVVAIQSAPASTQDGGFDPPTVHVLHSQDLENWSSTAVPVIDDALPGGFTTSIVSGEGIVLVRYTKFQDGADRETNPESVHLLGTLRS